jgi:hypothetical protein
MSMLWKCSICQVMVPNKELNAHRKTISHKTRLYFLDILETLIDKVHKNEYNDEQLEILLKMYTSNPFNMDMDLDSD